MPRPPDDPGDAVRRIEDSSLLGPLEAACFPRPWSHEQLLGELAAAGSFALLASRGGAPAGYVLYRVLTPEAELLRLGVRPAWRRQGVARELLAEGDRRLVAAGVRRVFLEVAASNVAAVRLYESLGWRREGRRAAYYRDGDDALILARDLP